MFIDHKLRSNARIGTPVNLALALGYLPSFDNVVAVTSNTCCVMTTTGAYDEVCGPQQSQVPRPGMRLVVDTTSFLDAVIAPAVPDAGLPPSIQFHDIDGAVLHRTYLTSAADELVLDCLRASTPSAPATDAGSAAILPFSGSPDQRRFVDRQVISHLLAYLAVLRLPIRIAVSSGACSHSDGGALDEVFIQTDKLVVNAGATTLSFDPAAIKGWSAGTGTLEALSADGSIVLTMGPIGETSSHPCRCWQEILSSLPPGPAIS